MIRIRILLCLACCWSVVSAHPLRAQEAPPAHTLCDVKLKGDSVKSLTLVKQGNASYNAMMDLSGQTYPSPGESLQVAPGRYRVTQVVLAGGLESSQYFAEEKDWFVVEAGKPCELVLGAPLTPHVTVSRHGKYLEMDYQLLDGAGRNYTQSLSEENPFASPQFSEPRFSVYKDGTLLGSEAFQYG